MPSLTELLDAISSLLDLADIQAVLQLNNSTRERAFEAYVFSLMVTAIREAGGSAEIYGRNSGPNPEVVVFRGGPGLLGSDAQDFAYASCALGSRHFEFHVDVQYEGHSQAIHELDVSIYDHDAAEKLRQNPNLFAKTNKLYGAVECKCYDDTLGTSLGRTFVGLVDDCGALELKLFVTNGLSHSLNRYFSLRRRPNRFFRLSPLHPNQEREFVEFVKHTFREWARAI